MSTKTIASSFRGSLYDSDSDDEFDTAAAIARISDKSKRSADIEEESLDELDEVNEADYIAVLSHRSASFAEAEVMNYRRSLKLSDMLEGCNTESDAKEAKRIFKMRKSTKELLETERAYAEDLASIQLIHRQLRDQFIAEQESSVIFKNIDWLVDTHATLLSTVMKIVPDLHLPPDVLDLNAAIVRIIDIYRETDFLSIYAPYCANHPAQLATLRTRKEDPELAEVLHRWQEQLNVSLPLETYLLKPIQRVLKYKLLFAEILKSAVPNDTCYAKLVEVRDVFEEVAVNTNQLKRQRELKNLLMGEVKVIRGLSLAEKLQAGGFEGDLNDFGSLVDEVDQATMVIHRVLLKKQSKPKLRKILLFEFAIFSCKVYDENKVSPKEIFPLHEIEVHVDGSRTLRIIESGDSYVFDGLDAQSWADQIAVCAAAIPYEGSSSPKTPRTKNQSKKRFQKRKSKKSASRMTPSTGVGISRLSSTQSQGQSASRARSSVISARSARPADNPTQLQLSLVSSERDLLRERNNALLAAQAEQAKEIERLRMEKSSSAEGSASPTSQVFEKSVPQELLFLSPAGRQLPQVLDIGPDGVVQEEGATTDRPLSPEGTGPISPTSLGRDQFKQKLMQRQKDFVAMIWEETPFSEAENKVNIESLYNLMHPMLSHPQVLFDRHSCRGYLIKRGNFRKNWLKRWFVFSLKSKNLSYYRDDSETHLKGSIPLVDVCSTVIASSIKRVNPEIEATAAQVFHIITLDRTYHLLAPDRDTLGAWHFLLEMVRTDINPESK